VSLTGQLTDDDPDAQLTLTVDWGDSSQPDVIQPGLDPFKLRHQYDQAGTYTVRAIWSDTLNGSNFQELSLTVDPESRAGMLDATFGTEGKVFTDFGLANDIANAVALQPDGKLVGGGWAGNDFSLARYNPDGSLDPSFGDGGTVRTNFANGAAESVDDIDGIALQPDGKIVAVGGSNGDFALARYNPDGSLDSSFGTGGLVVTDFGTGNARARGVALQADGKIVVAGTTGGTFAMACYLPDGTLDPDFNGSGWVITDFGHANDIANAVALQADGEIVLGGWAGNDFCLAEIRWANRARRTTLGNVRFRSPR
jgi:uncharacterized delta-60 repeat protein